MGIDPASMAIFSLASTVIGGVTQAVGAQQQAQAQAQAANYQAQVAANNATIAQQNAAYATRAGEAQAQAQGQKDRQIAGAVTAGIAANDVDVNSGSAADVRQGTGQAGLLDTETVRQNAALQSYGYRTQATGFTAQSQLDTLQAKNAQTAGSISAFSSLLGAASSAGTKFSNFQNQGLFGGGGGGLSDNSVFGAVGTGGL